MTRIRERGTVVLEFLLIGTGLVLLTLGVMELGRGLQTYLELTNAAREGARFRALAGTSDADARCWTVRSAPNLASRTAANPCDPNLPAVEGSRCILRVSDVTVAPGPSEPGGPVNMAEVSIAYRHGLFFVPAAALAPTTDCLGRPAMTLAVRVRMRLE